MRWYQNRLKAGESPEAVPEQTKTGKFCEWYQNQAKLGESPEIVTKAGIEVLGNGTRLTMAKGRGLGMVQELTTGWGRSGNDDTGTS